MKKLLLFIVVALTTLNVNAQLNSGLVAYWPLDGNANDISGNGHNGYYKTVDWVSDRSSLLNTGCAAYIESEIVISDDLSGYMRSTPFSLSFWFRKKQGATYSIGSLFQNSCLKDLGMNQSYFLYLGGKSIDLSKEQWYHIVYARGSDSVRVFVNNTKVVAFVKAFDCLAGYSSQLAPSLGGTLDDFRIYSRALTTSEVTELYNLPSSCKTITRFDNEQYTTSKTLVRIVTPLGVELKKDDAKKGIFIYQYSDGSTRKVLNTD